MISLWHDILLNKKCMIEVRKFYKKEAAIQQFLYLKELEVVNYINNLTKNELIEIIDEYKNIVKKYPKNGLGVEPLCQDAGLEDPLSTFKIEKLDLDSKLN